MGALEGAEAEEEEDTDGLIKPKAFVVLKSGLNLTEDELKLHVKSQLAPYKYPRWVEFVPDLPKTATGTGNRTEAIVWLPALALQQNTRAQRVQSHDLLQIRQTEATYKPWPSAFASKEEPRAHTTK